MLDVDRLTDAVTKSVRDFGYYFHDFDCVQNPKLEEWIRDAILEELRRQNA